MAKVKTDQRVPIVEIAIRACKTHGDKYDYSNIRYVDGTKIAIFCKVHEEEFFQAAKDHVGGQGCPKCGRMSARKKRTLTQEEFETRAELRHPGMYDYSSAKYTKSQNFLDIICKKHNITFRITANSLMGGCGCPLCGKDKISEFHVKTHEAALRDFVSVHGNKYDYSKTTYINSKTKMVVTCRNHGDFTIQPYNHLLGKGCIKCAKNGYQPNKAGFLYVLQGDGLTKVGITNRKVSDRSKSVSKSSGSQFKCVYDVHFTDGTEALLIETVLLRELRQTHKQPAEKFDGSTECFYDVDIQALLKRIEELIEEHSNANY